MYRFENLKHRSVNQDFNTQSLYDRTQSLCSNNYVFYSDKKEILLVLSALLSDKMDYYVLHERILVKGKLRKFIGHVVIAKKMPIIEFIRKSLDENDLRPIRIISTLTNDNFFRFSEDAVLYVYAKN